MNKLRVFTLGTIVLALILAICLAQLTGCSQQGRSHRHYIILLDVSGSIEKQAEEQAFEAITQMISKIRRGDLVTVIPITGDAEVEVEGKILRLSAPLRREAYDQDRKRFSAEVTRSLERSKAAAVAHPGRRSDILGTIRVAREEFALDPPGTEQALIVLSDFIQDDGTENFKYDPMLRSVKCAKQFAANAARQGHFLQPVRVFLGMLRSTDMAALDSERRAAIREFWQDYFKSIETEPTFASDGPGIIQRF